MFETLYPYYVVLCPMLIVSGSTQSLKKEKKKPIYLLLIQFNLIY